MRTGEQNVPICDQNAHEAVGNDSVENDPGTEQVQDAEHLRASEMAVSGQNERLEERVVEQGLEETASKMVREEKVSDGKVEMVVTVQGSKKEGEVRQKQSDVGNVESSISKEEFVTPKKSGGLTNEDFFVQFATAMEAIVKGTFERKGSKGKEGGLGSKNSAQVRGKEVSKGAKGEVRVFNNTMEWVKVVEEFMKEDKDFDQKVKEALKEVNTYLWTVYDKEKEEYIEEGINRAMRAAAIFLVKVKHCPSWGSENGLLGSLMGSWIYGAELIDDYWKLENEWRRNEIKCYWADMLDRSWAGNGRSNGLRRIKRQWALPFVTADEFVSVLNDALKSMYNAEKRGKRQVMIRHSSKVIVKFLLVMQKHGYIGEFEYVDDHRAGKIVVELNGRLNKCGVISPRFDIGVKDIEGWTARLLPSRQFGYIVLTTSAGIMDHEEARRKNAGGKVLGFFY
nr:40S ribosomal protein S15a-1 [Ipomoea batatas]